jgi:hypothetical protein
MERQAWAHHHEIATFAATCVLRVIFSEFSSTFFLGKNWWLSVATIKLSSGAYI